MKRSRFTTHSTADIAMTSMAASQIITYAQSRKPEDLGEVVGVPVTYHYRRLTRAQWAWIDGSASEAERAERTFRAGVIMLVGGELEEAWAPDGVGSEDHVCMTDAEFDSVYDRVFARGDVADVARVIYTRSILLPKAEPRFPPVAMSAHAWDALQRPSAAPTQQGAPQSSEERSAA